MCSNTRNSLLGFSGEAEEVESFSTSNDGLDSSLDRLAGETIWTVSESA